MLKNYATASIFGLAHDMPYYRRSRVGIAVDNDYVKRLKSMRFRLRRCATECDEEDFHVVSPSDSLEAWAFKVVFWEPCGCAL
jgi:hypothetical protein